MSSFVLFLKQASATVAESKKTIKDKPVAEGCYKSIDKSKLKFTYDSLKICNSFIFMQFCKMFLLFLL